MTPTVSRLLFTSTVTLALVCAPKAAFGKHHGGGSRGGSGSHSGGSHGGGRPHSGSGRGFHGGGGGPYGGKSLGRGLSAAPWQMGGGSHKRSGGWAFRPNTNAAFGARHWVGSYGPRSMIFNSNRPPSAGPASRSWSGQSQSSRASTPRSAFSFYPNHGLSNFGNSRFDNSAFGHSSFSNSRTGSSVPRFGGSRFGGAQQFDWGATSFHRETSFGGDDFSFFPNLFGLALDLGGFGLRGLGMLGSGLGGFGVRSLDLLGSRWGGFSLDAGLESRQWEPGSTFYPTGNLTCPQ
jgi:hypothetical protein